VAVGVILPAWIPRFPDSLWPDYRWGALRYVPQGSACTGMETHFGEGRFEKVRTALRINTWELYLVLPLEGLRP
jgi:hypothetical protein